jgi:phosphatidylglycerol---prolipoprotein diacylglyceryl transferase
VIAFYLPGQIPVYVYSVFLALGACVGLAWIAGRSSQKLALRQVEAGMWVLLGGLIGSRLAYVAASWLYYQDHILESPQFYRGGLSWPGALAGGLLALVTFAAFNHISLAGLADDLLPLLVALSVGAWLGCWVAGCTYGIASDAWWSIPSPDEWGVVANRWPIQIWGALLTVGLFALLERLAGATRLKQGYRALLGLLGLSLILLGTSLLRADPAITWNGLRLEAWAALAFILLAFIGLVGYSYSQAQAKIKLIEEHPV